MSQVRKLIDGFTEGRGVSKIYVLIPALAWLVPSSTDLGSYYIVVKSRRYGMICCCKGFRFGGRHDEKCQHTDKIREKLRGKK